MSRMQLPLNRSLLRIFFIIFVVFTDLEADPVPSPLPPEHAEIMSVSQLHSGMKGWTYTVMQGNQIVPLETEISGVAKNFLGPGLDLIMAKLVDEKTKVTGAVHGMSGSPLYIDGKLVGALSHGVTTFEKDGQCGYTPILDMIKVDSLAHKWEEISKEGGGETLPELNFTDLQNDRGAGNVKPLSVPLSVSGIAPELVTHLIKKVGLERCSLMAVSSGGMATSESAAKGGVDPMEIKPGAPLAVVLMTGDISMAGTGTCTWRDGNRVVAFGHALFGFGTSDLPIAGAEIVTTIPSYEMAFKLSNTGSKMLGTLTQDRIAAVAGILGPVPRMGNYRVERTHHGEKIKTISGQFAENSEMTPILLAAPLASSLSNSLETAHALTIRVNGEIRLAGHTPLDLTGVYSGEGSEISEMVLDQILPIAALIQKRYEHVHAEDLTVTLETEEKLNSWSLVSMRAEENKVKPGGVVHLYLRLKQVYGNYSDQEVQVKLPEHLQQGKLILRVGGSREVDDGRLSAALQGSRSVEEMISVFNQRRIQDRIYIQVITPGEGQLVKNKEMPSLPDSIQQVMQESNTTEDTALLHEQIWQEVSAGMPGPVGGLEELSLEIE